jgi:hypothetical protein
VVGQLCEIADAATIVLDRDGPGALGRDAKVGGSGIERIVDQSQDKVDDVVDGTVDQNVVTEVDVECKSPW